MTIRDTFADAADAALNNAIAIKAGAICPARRRSKPAIPSAKEVVERQDSEDRTPYEPERPADQRHSRGNSRIVIRDGLRFYVGAQSATTDACEKTWRNVEELALTLSTEHAPVLDSMLETAGEHVTGGEQPGWNPGE